MNNRVTVFTAGTYDPAGVGGFGSLTPTDPSFSSIIIMMLDFGLILVFRIYFISFFDSK